MSSLNKNFKTSRTSSFEVWHETKRCLYSRICRDCGNIKESDQSSYLDHEIMGDRRWIKNRAIIRTRGVIDSIGKVCLDGNNNGKDSTNKEESICQSCFFNHYQAKRKS